MLSVDEFVEAVIPDLARYAAGLTGSREGAHDVVADALLYVIGHWDRIGQMARPAAYVQRVVTTTFLQGVRRAKNERRAFQRSFVNDQASDPTGEAEDRDEIKHLLSRLPASQLAAVVMYYYLDLNAEQIGVNLGCSAAAARAHLSKARARLRVITQTEVPRMSGDVP